jgi:hypothetical protein
MARKRLQQSTADYLAIAISPALIMMLVGSLVFFLQEVSYQGQFEGRVRWMLGWFVFATVLISRIGIEFGKAHASMYAGALALACTAFAFRFLEEYIVGIVVLMAIIWWCVNKLTWDCTVIDDSIEVTSAGLLQQSGMDRPPEVEEEEELLETDKQKKRRLRREQLLGETGEGNSSDQLPDPSEALTASDKQRSPGVWVVYFSLAALPLFGVGQAFLPAEEGSVREGFLFLWVYVASALGLFLTTSFLGLRRYLRQRRITMPTSITAAWVTSGVVMMLLVLGLCMLIPRPHAETSVTALLDRFADDQAASNVALSSNDAGQGDGRRAGKVDENSEDPGDKMSEEGEPVDAEGDGKKSGKSDQKGDSKEGGEEKDQQNQEAGEKEKEDDQKQQQAGNSEKQQEQANKKSDSSSSPSKKSRLPKMPQFASGLKWILYIVFGGVILWALWTNRHDLAAGAREFLQSIVNFWANLFSPKKKKKRTVDDSEDYVADAGPTAKSFAEYENPFTTGLAQSMSPDALVLYTEEAFRAFAREFDIPTGEEITAAEVGYEVTGQFPNLAEPIRFLTTAHSRILYSSRPPISFDVTLLEQLWTGMARREPQSVG